MKVYRSLVPLERKCLVCVALLLLSPRNSWAQVDATIPEPPPPSVTTTTQSSPQAAAPSAAAQPGARAAREAPPGSTAHCEFESSAGTVEAAREWCTDQLLPGRPYPYIQTPGSFLVGYVWGEHQRAFVYGPAAGIAGAVAIPLKRPALEWVRISGKHAFRLPQRGSFVADFVASLNANLAGLKINGSKKVVETDPDKFKPGDTTEFGFTAGAFVALQLGSAWYEDKSPKKLMFSFGAVAAYLNTETLGNSFVVGLQPAIVAQF